MALFTKSIQKMKSKQDGIRICIMRRPQADLDWDIWIPHLAPSDEILTLRHSGQMTFEEHRNWFKKNVLQKKSEYIDIIIDLALKRDATLLCWEENPLECHRSWVANECIKKASGLKVVIK